MNTVSEQEFKIYLETVYRSMGKDQASLLGETIVGLYNALNWGLHEQQEVVEVTAKLNEYLQSGGLFGHNRNYELLQQVKASTCVLTKRLGAHQQEYMGAIAEHLDLLTRTHDAVRASATSVMDISKLMQLQETFNRVKEDYDRRNRLTDERYSYRNSELQRLEKNNAFMRKVLNAEEQRIKPATTTIRSRRNVIVAEFSGLTLYIDVGGTKLYDSLAAMIAGYCYQDLFPLYGEGMDNKITTGEVRELSVCFKHVGEGKGEIVFQEAADAKTIKSFEDALYNRKGE